MITHAHVGALEDIAKQALNHGAAIGIAEAVVKRETPCSKVDTKWVLATLNERSDADLVKAFQAECTLQKKQIASEKGLEKLPIIAWIGIVAVGSYVTYKLFFQSA